MGRQLNTPFHVRFKVHSFGDRYVNVQYVDGKGSAVLNTNCLNKILKQKAFILIDGFLYIEGDFVWKKSGPYKYLTLMEDPCKI